MPHTKQVDIKQKEAAVKDCNTNLYVSKKEWIVHTLAENIEGLLTTKLSRKNENSQQKKVE